MIQQRFLWLFMASCTAMVWLVGWVGLPPLPTAQADPAHAPPLNCLTDVPDCQLSGASLNRPTLLPAFEDSTVVAGVTNTHHPHYTEAPDFTERYLVTGQAWGDYDRDGWEDLYITDHYGSNQLFRNNGDGTFTRSPWAAAVSLPDSISGGATWADYNNDGWLDLYVLNFGPNRLFHNDAGQGFTDVTITAGVGDAGKGSTAAWGDYDQDGHLDLYVTNWTCWPECGFDPDWALQRDTLYHNNGDGTFTDVTSLLIYEKTIGAGFAVSWVDYDNDGDLDLYVVNDEFQNPIGNVLWRNDGPGCGGWCFTDVSTPSGAGIVLYGMGLAVGDYDNDQDLDFYFSNMMEPAVLLQNQGDGTFLDVSAAAGVDFVTDFSWGTVFFDFDNDGWLDLYLANTDDNPLSNPSLPNPLFHNQGDGTFINLDAASGAGDTGSTLGVAYADYDGNGFPDLVIGNLGASYVLYRNLATEGADHNWLTVELEGDAAGVINRDAIGSRITLTTHAGQTQLQELISGSSLGSGNSLRLHFGLGSSTVDTLTVRWPDGLTETFTNTVVAQEMSIPHNTLWRLSYPQAGIGLGPDHAASTPPNTVISYTHTLTNSGNRQDTFTLSLASTYGWSTVTPASVTLTPQATAQVTVTVTVPNAPGLVETSWLTATSTLNPAMTQTVTDVTEVLDPLAVNLRQMTTAPVFRWPIWLAWGMAAILSAALLRVVRHRRHP